MASTHSQFQVGWTHSAVSWTGELQPAALSDKYMVRIQYTFGRRPRVFVLRPTLQARVARERIPHTFSDGSLCLHVREDWTPAMFIADTIVPWTSLWLYYYEVWHAIGEWLGGGHEPGVAKDEQAQNTVY
jgi:hypothetical protein